jgi:hypothetical protein
MNRNIQIRVTKAKGKAGKLETVELKRLKR